MSTPRLLSGQAATWTIALLCACAPLIYWLGACTGVDLLLADAVFDHARGVFPWRHAWLAETFNHRILKGALTAAAVALIGAALVDAVRPLRRLRMAGRLRLRVIALSAACVPLAIGLLKQHSSAHCPWDLARYAGDAPYLRIFEALPPGVLPGHCLPAGHASSALWLVALAVLWLPASPRKALLAAGGALAFGLGVGWLQQLRGAHFLTHTLWSMWIACAVVLALVLLVQGRARRRPLPRPAGAGRQDAILDGSPT